jgi:hypothetical protein
VGAPALAARADPPEVDDDLGAELCAPPAPSKPNSLLACDEDDLDDEDGAAERGWRDATVADCRMVCVTGGGVRLTAGDDVRWAGCL